MKIITLSLIFAISLLSANETTINLKCYPYQFTVGGVKLQEH